MSPNSQERKKNSVGTFSPRVTEKEKIYRHLEDKSGLDIDPDLIGGIFLLQFRHLLIANTTYQGNERFFYST